MSAPRIPRPVGPGWGRWVGRAIALGFWNTRIVGAENVPKTGPVIVAANHLGLADGPLMIGCTPRGTHILVKVEGSGSPDDQRAALAKAEAIAKKVAEGGDFAKIAKEESADLGSRNQGGELGWIERGMTDQAFEDALYALKQANDVSAPVLGSDGYHIIRLDDRRDPKTKTLEQAKKSIERALQKEQADRRLAELKEDIRKKANVKVNDEYFKRFDASPEAPEVEEARGSGEPEEQ